MRKDAGDRRTRPGSRVRMGMRQRHGSDRSDAGEDAGGGAVLRRRVAWQKAEKSCVTKL